MAHDNTKHFNFHRNYKYLYLIYLRKFIKYLRKYIKYYL